MLPKKRRLGGGKIDANKNILDLVCFFFLLLGENPSLISLVPSPFMRDFKKGRTLLPKIDPGCCCGDSFCFVAADVEAVVVVAVVEHICLSERT